MLPLLKDNIEGAELQYFVDHFLPILAHLREKGRKFLGVIILLYKWINEFILFHISRNPFIMAYCIP